jgi:hypothetical protein
LTVFNPQARNVILNNAFIVIWCKSRIFGGRHFFLNGVNQEYLEDDVAL